MDKCKVGLSSPYIETRTLFRRASPRALRNVGRVLSVVVAAFFSPAHALTQEELVAKLQAAGYSQIRDIKSTAEGISVKATKDGKDVSLVVDSSGQVKERR